jgi:ABC-type transport system involved in multi-copper enzyme maturation permease subunit
MMLKRLWKRQLVEDLISFKFLILASLILAALISFSLIFAGDYQRRQEERSQNGLENGRRLQAAASSLVNLLQTPQRLQMEPGAPRFVADGYERQIPSGFLVTMLETRLLDEPKEPGVRAYGSLDLMFIVQFVFSFFALVLTFNSVSLEKEKGTLRLIFSNGLKRAELLLAKYLSAFLTVGLPFILGLLISLILLSLQGILTLSGSFAALILLFSLLSLLYLSFFILLGLLWSIAAYSSKNSLVLCLLSWVLIVVILPKSAGLLLDLKALAVPTGKEIEEKAERAYREVWDSHAGEDLTTGEPEAKSTQLNIRIGNEAQKAKQEVYDLYLRKKTQAVETLMAINCVSPASLYEYAASAAAGTGLPHFKRLWRQVNQYQIELVDFFRAEDMKDRESPHLFFHSDYLSRKPVDFNKIPRFKEQEPAPGERLKDAARYGAVLVLFNIFLFVLVFSLFQKYDVR